MKNRVVKWIVWALILLAVILYPKIFGIYYTNALVILAIFALYAVSYNLLLGFTGLFSFGHAMFFGISGYTTALMLSHIEGVPILVVVFCGFLSSVLLALILSPIVARVAHSAFAMLHLAFSMLLFVLALKLRHITGGEDGIGGFDIPALNILGIVSFDMTDPLAFYYFAMTVLIGTMWLTWFLTKTPFGQIIISIRDNDKRVAYMGFKVTESKAAVYAIACGIAGVAGSVYAMFQNLISAEALSIQISFSPILMTMIGGVGTFMGPIFGSAIFQIIEELTSRFTERYMLVEGLILIIVIMFFPYGFMGFVGFIKERFMAWKAARKATEEDA